MNRIDVLLTSAIPPYLTDGLRERYTTHDRAERDDPAVAGRIRALVGGGESRVDAALLAALPALEVICVCGVGYDGVDVASARARGLGVTHTPGVLDDDVADLAMGLLLSVARRIPQADRFTRSGAWESQKFPLARKFSGSRLGLVGLGRIGQAIARRAAAFDLPISYTARHRHDQPYAFYPNPTTLAAEVDFLVVITPGGEETRGLIDAEVLRALGPSGFLINVSRGSVVDQDALLAALQSGGIAGAGLDVYADEPRVPEALRALENVVLTPHMASATTKTRQAMSELTLANLDAHFAGRPLLTPVPELQSTSR